VETATVTAVVAERARPVVVAGDLNERPDGAVHGQLTAAGLHDGWSLRRHDQAGADQPAEPAAATGATATPGGRSTSRPDPWPTNWSRWRRGTTEPPTRRLDYVYISDAIRLLDIRTPPPAEYARFAAISDHLPVTAVLEVG
jgi:endonuclease/exonuclease/phosphatase family metal-dependent hydrolase